MDIYVIHLNPDKDSCSVVIMFITLNPDHPESSSFDRIVHTAEGLGPRTLSKTLTAQCQERKAIAAGLDKLFLFWLSCRETGFKFGLPDSQTTSIGSAA